MIYRAFTFPSQARRMTPPKPRIVTLLFGAIAAVALAVVVAGCGNEVPPNAVAKVGDATIEKSEFNRWLSAAARGQQAPGEETQQTAAPDPPSYTKCVAAKQKQPTPKGAKKPTPAQLKDQCKQEYESLRDQVMQFLISSEWIQQEAESMGVEATPQEVDKSFKEEKERAFPNDKDYKEFLKTSGQTEADLKFRIKLNVLSNEVQKKVTEGKGNVTNEDIENYYNKNKKRFGQPERRDLVVVLTKSKSRADQAKKALEDGDAWKTVAKKYSIDEASKSQGGKLPGVAKGQQEKALDAAVFEAKKGEIEGPVKTQFGYYVFEVTKITPASQQSLQQARDTIKNLLKSEREQKALDGFIKDFQEKYKDETECAKGYVVQDCKNAPKPKTETGPATGGQPGGPQQAPQAPPPEGGQAPGGAPQPQPQQPQGGQAPPVQPEQGGQGAPQPQQPQQP
jgi:foldase protein PrsA